MSHDREVGGLRCGEVLAHLSEFLDGEAPPDTVARIYEHLRGCDWCERFGGRFTGIVTTLRRTLATPEPVDPGLLERVAARLHDEG
ncbi:MAG: zf-HC2 domain-containing protein [Pseudomonadota bacterium]|nr:zf-HC2 domain-containing protein [Pseudomonadota bacterium]